MINKAFNDKALKETDNAIEPEHYDKGEIDLIESWYLTYPFNEFRAGMQMLSQRYQFRKKEDRVQDLNKGINVLERLKEYEIRELEKEKEND